MSFVSDVISTVPRIETVPPATAAPRRRFSGLRRIVSPLLLLLVWQVGSAAGVISDRMVPAPSRIIASLFALTASGELPQNLAVSLERVCVGLGIAIVLGVGFALFAGLSRRGEEAVDAPLQMLRTMPHLALVPLFILWFGIGETPKIALVALGGLFPIYLTLFAGIRGVDPKLIEMSNVFGLTRREQILHVVLPGALPSALVGFRYAVGVGWLSLVVAEQINADSGIGYMMMNARDFLRTDVIMVGLLVYALLGLAADQLVRAIERRTLVWRPSLVGA